MIDAFCAWLGAVAPERRRATGGLVVALYRNSPKAVLILVGDDGAPAALVKVARDVSAEPSLVAEHEALAGIAATGGEWLRRNAPSPIALDRVAGRLALAETFLDGRPMTSRYYRPGHTASRRRVLRDFGQAARWLARLRQETSAAPRVLDDEAVDALIRAPIERYRAEIGSSEFEEELFADALAVAESLRGTQLNIAAEHGDFWMGNVLIDRAGVTGAVDWEHAALATSPIDDVYKFATSYSFYLNRASPRSRRVPGHPGWAEAAARWGAYGDWANLAGFGYAYFGHGWFPSLVRAWIEDGAGALGIPPAGHAAFFPAFLARQATRLSNPVFRNGYRSTLIGLSRERRRTWLWRDGSISPRTSFGSPTHRFPPVSPAGRST